MPTSPLSRLVLPDRTRRSCRRSADSRSTSSAASADPTQTHARLPTRQLPPHLLRGDPDPLAPPQAQRPGDAVDDRAAIAGVVAASSAASTRSASDTIAATCWASQSPPRLASIEAFAAIFVPVRRVRGHLTVATGGGPPHARGASAFTARPEHRHAARFAQEVLTMSQATSVVALTSQSDPAVPLRNEH